MLAPPKRHASSLSGFAEALYTHPSIRIRAATGAAHGCGMTFGARGGGQGAIDGERVRPEARGGGHAAIGGPPTVCDGWRRSSDILQSLWSWSRVAFPLPSTPSPLCYAHAPGGLVCLLFFGL